MDRAKTSRWRSDAETDRGTQYPMVLELHHRSTFRAQAISLLHYDIDIANSVSGNTPREPVAVCDAR